MLVTVVPPPESPASPVPPGLLQRRPGELAAPPISFKPTVQGVPLTIPVSCFLALAPAGSQIQIGVRAVADLSDLQAKIGSLIDTIPLPTNPCDHFGVDNVVPRIWGKGLTIEGSVATLALKGDVNVWACAKNPVPCSRIEWDETTVFGVVVRVPRTVFYDCNPPVNKQIANQPFDAAIPFSVALVNPRTVAVQLGNPTINLGGALGGVTSGILQIAGVDLSSQAKGLLDRALNPDLLQQTLPTDLLPFHPAITRAELVNNAGALALYAEMSASIDGKVIGQLIRKIFVG
jgi:hypothetical protein